MTLAPKILVGSTLIGVASSVAAAGTVGVTVIIENLAPDNGTYLTPVWVGFHDGSFDTHTLNVPASLALERLAEDGDTSFLLEMFDATVGSAAQGTIVSDEGIPPLAPGETATMQFVLNGDDPMNRYFSYASMVIPSNDAFIANDDPGQHQIFDFDGNFIGAFFTITGGAVKDAGTEVNDELPEHTAFFGQSEPDSGIDEFGVVHMHPGFLPPGSGGILDDPMFANADFTQPGYEVARVLIVRSDTIVPPGAVSGTWTAAGSPYLVAGDIVVPSGETLAIEPGVQVIFQNGVKMVVEGTILAEGAAESPILFTADPDVPGWSGIEFFHAADDCVLSHCIVERGRAMGAFPSNYGGGISCDNSNPLIANCVLRFNEATTGAGAMYCFQSAPTILDSVFHDNLVGFTTTGRGGAIFADQSMPTIIGNVFQDNLVVVSNVFGPANGRGGAIALTDSDAIIDHNVFVGNIIDMSGNVGTSAGGGAISATSCDPQISHNTIIQNEATGFPADGLRGGGLYFRISNPVVYNNIVANNVSEGIYFDDFSGGDVRYNDVFGNTEEDYGGPDVPAGLGVIVQENQNGDPADAFFNISLDPMLVDVAGGDYSLQSESPCIDAGDPNTPNDPDGTVADQGALPHDQGQTMGDLNGDGVVDANDLAILLGSWGPCPGCPSDLNGDGVVDAADLAILLGNWG